MLRAVPKFKISGKTRNQFGRVFCFLRFVHCFWRSEDKKGTSSTTNAAYSRPIFCATMVRDWFFQILHIICFDDKTTRNQQRSTDKLASIRDVFESTISRFQKAYTPNEHITTDKQLVVFRGKYPFSVFIQSKPGKYGIKLWIAADAQNFYANNMQVHTGKNDEVREKKQGLQVVKDMACYMYRTRRGVTADNFFTSCELGDFLLTKKMTVIGTLKKNKFEIPALFFLVEASPLCM